VLGVVSVEQAPVPERAWEPFAVCAAAWAPARLRTSLALQFAQFVVLQIQQAMRVRELCFQILTGPQRLRFTAGSGLAAAVAGTAAGTRRHQTQVAAGWVRCCRARLPFDDALRSSPRLIQRRDFIAARHAQHGTGRKILMLPPNASGFERYMAIMV